MNQNITNIRCPQCNSLCNKTETALTHEHSVQCNVCGYQEIKTVSGTEIFKGYGSLNINGTIILFHTPVPFEKEKEILKSISSNSNAVFIKWTDEHELTVLKGELPEEYSEEEILNLIAEEEYYKSLSNLKCHDDIIPF